MLDRPAELQSVLRRQDGLRVTVIRVALADGRTVVAKRGRSFAADDPAAVPKSAWAFFNEWAALQLLEAVCPGVAPRVVAVDGRVGVLVLEDLGDAPNLPDVLSGEDSVKAEQALLVWTSCLARLHATTAHATARFRQTRDAMSGGGTLDGYLDVAGEELRFGAACAAVGLTRPSESHDLFARAMTPTALIHGDIGGGNELINAGSVSLIDFEVSGLANAMIEAAILRMLLHQGEAEYALPDDVVAALEAEYARQAPMTAEAYALGCAYVFCMEFGYTYAERQPRDSDIAKTGHRARMLLELDDRQGGVPAGIRAVAAAVAGPALPAWPAFR